MNITYRIYYTLPDGSEDSLPIDAETIEELQSIAAVEIAARKATDPWSEKVE
jgi:hypothetical protein